MLKFKKQKYGTFVSSINLTRTSMTQKEVILELLNRKILFPIGKKYYFTEDYYTILEKLDYSGLHHISNIDTAENLNTKDLYPIEIRGVKPSKRVEAFMDYCKIPTTVKRDGKSYVVRSNVASTKVVLDRIMADPDIIPAVLLKSVKEYYDKMDYPKSFKNFVADGDISSIYTLYAQGGTLGSGNDKPIDSTTWL